jgi:hypothetical protein
LWASTPFIFRPNSTFSRTVFHGNSEYCWNTMPRSAPGRSTATLSTVTVPAVGLMKPATALRRVDFPQPDGPMIETNSPGLTSIETSFAASIGPSAAA